MSLKLRKELSPAAASQPPQTIEGWLAILSALLPRAQAESIRDELETHLRDRVRDLMVGGMNEAHAMRTAIAELGEAADLAAKYRALQIEPRRRLAMYGSIFGVAGAALIVSVTALIAGPRQQPAQPQPPAARAADDRALELAKQNKDFAAAIASLQSERDKLAAERDRLLAERARTVNAAVFEPVLPGGPHAADVNKLRFDVGFNNITVAEALKSLARMVNRPIEFDERTLTEAGLDGKKTISLNVAATTFPDALAEINAQLPFSQEGQQLDYRVAEPAADAKTKPAIRISTRAYFDKREQKLVSYDLASILASRIAAEHQEREKVVLEISKLLTDFVSATDWRDNGGELATLSIVGDRMFVSAPARMHPQVKWMLEQLAAGAASVPFLSDIPILGKMFKQSEGPAVRIYRLQKNDATATATRLRAAIGEGESGLWSVKVDQGANSIIVNGSESQHSQVRDLLAQVGEETDVPPAAAALQTRSYPLKNINADEALAALKANLAIRKIDFSTFAADTRINAILGRVTLEGHGMILAALGDIDTPEFAHKFQMERQAASEIAAKCASLKRFESDIQVLTEQVAQVAPDSPQAGALNSQLQKLQSDASMLRREIEDLQSRARGSRS